MGADEMTLVRSGLALAFACAAACIPLPAAAQYPLEIIPLRHRTADQVIPALEPLLDQGATLSGQSGQLFVRTSPENVVELRRALEAIDTPARRLQILVRFEGGADAASRDVSASGFLSNRGSQIELRAGDARTGETERIDQRVQVLDGGQAFIATAQSRPVPQRQLIQTPVGVVPQQTMVVQQAQTGFLVVPRVTGQTVTMEIAPQRESLGPGGTVQSQRAVGTVSGSLGEWFELGGLAESGANDARGIGTASQARSSGSRSVWVKVEELRVQELRN
jgi:hypothetical protein